MCRIVRSGPSSYGRPCRHGSDRRGRRFAVRTARCARPDGPSPGGRRSRGGGSGARPDGPLGGRRSRCGGSWRPNGLARPPIAVGRVGAPNLAGRRSRFGVRGAGSAATPPVVARAVGNRGAVRGGGASRRSRARCRGPRRRTSRRSCGRRSRSGRPRSTEPGAWRRPAELSRRSPRRGTGRRWPARRRGASARSRSRPRPAPAPPIRGGRRGGRCLRRRCGWRR